MLFDQICGIAERHMPSSMEFLKRCRLFTFDRLAYTPKILMDHPKHFYLPFKQICLETDTFCVMLQDSEPNQMGFDEKRYYSVFLSFQKAVGASTFEEYKISQELARQFKGDTFFVSGGELVKNANSKKLGINDLSVTASIRLYNKLNGRILKGEKIIKQIYGGEENAEETFIDAFVRRGLTSALTLINYVNNPNYFVLEKRSIKEKVKKAKDKKIKRSHQRPVYTVLKPNQIREKIGLSHVGKTGVKSPHERRRHIRYLSHKMYSEKGKNKPQIIPAGPRRGQAYYKKIVVASTWIGPSEKIIGNKKYRVILDQCSV